MPRKSEAAEEFNGIYTTFSSLEEKQIKGMPEEMSAADPSAYAYLTSKKGKIIARRALSTFPAHVANRLNS